MIILLGHFLPSVDVFFLKSANITPHDPLSIFVFVGLPLVSVLGLMSGTRSMYRAHFAQQGRFMFMYLLAAFTAFAGSVVFLLIWVFLFFQMK